MEQSDKVRIDKWLFAMRLFKTRSLAADHCNRERVLIAGHSVKPSRLIKAGDEITIAGTGFKQVFQVLKLSDRRLSPKLVPDYCKNITPQEELDKLTMIRAQKSLLRERGSGRPTKRERRDLDEFINW